MKLPTFNQFRGIVFIVNTLLPVFLVLSLIWMYAFHFKPLIEEFQGQLFNDLKSIETLRDKYRAAEEAAAKAYQPIADLSQQIALLSESVCESSELEKILLFRNETLAKLETRNFDSNHRFVKTRVETLDGQVTLGQPAVVMKPEIRNRFSEFVIAADLRGWHKQWREDTKGRSEKIIGRLGPSLPRDPSDPPASPAPPALDPSGAVGDLTSTVKDHADQIGSLTPKILRRPAETCESLESHFQAVFFVFSSVFALFDEVKAAFSDFRNYLDVNFEAVWLRASSLYQVVKYSGIAIFFWLVVSYAVWVFDRLERGWKMIAGQRVEH